MKANMPQLINRDHPHYCNYRLYCNRRTDNIEDKVSDKKNKAEIKWLLKDVNKLLSEK